MANKPDTSPEGLPFFLTQNEGFGQINPEVDDQLHPDSFQDLPDDSATETQYFGFSVPEARIHGLTYMWHHPNLNLVTGGLFVWQGIKANTVFAELCDWRTFMSDRAIKLNPREFRLDNGYGVRTIEPFRDFHITYDDAANENHVDLRAKSVLPAVMTANGKHFDQTMAVKGKLVLRGRSFDVDCHTVRDKSWGKPRPETHLPFPPMSWMAGTFSDDFSFGCVMFDHASGQPERNGAWVHEDDKALNVGWVWRAGQLGRIVKAFKRVHREPGSTISAGVELRFSDHLGRSFDVRASLVASCPINNWNNVYMVVNLMRWECEGLVGYGDNQEAFWNPFINSAEFSGKVS